MNARSRTATLLDGFVTMPLRRLRDAVAIRVSEALFRAADAAARIPFRRDVATGNRTIIEDLVEFTGLPSAAVEDMVDRRSPTSFRSEWHATPEQLRRDRWYYLSSKTYLFANASHFEDDAFARAHVLPYTPKSGTVLDFGGGAGALSFALADHGLSVSYTELNALQRDFVRFRLGRRGLQGRIDVLDPWAALPRGAFDAIVAVDVLEHLDELRHTLDTQLLPALKPAGVLVENSPFVVNVSNPMHHEDFGFERHMAAAGYTVIANGADGTRVWRAP